MTTAPVVGGRPTAQQVAGTARRVAHTHPQLLTSVGFGPTIFARDEGVTHLAGSVAWVDQLGPDLNQMLDSVSQLRPMASRLPQAFRRRNHAESSPHCISTPSRREKEIP